ncbi:MAG: PIG-L family deacetylase [Egibacteraceae bacterium]
MSDLALLCVHAHPDDESLLTGGVLARCADEGIRACVVTCTGGERGHMASVGMDPRRLSADRREELRRALDILGVGPPRLLGYVDSGTAGDAGNDDEASFWRAPFDEAVGRMVAQIRELRPDVVVTYDAFGVYGHPDHIQAHRVTSIAVEAAEVAALYPWAGPAWRVRKLYQTAVPKRAIAWLNAWLAGQGVPSPFGAATRAEDLTFGASDERVTTTIDVSRWFERKHAAMLTHASGLGPNSVLANLPEAVARQAAGQEWFARVRCDVPAPAREDDLFAGLREPP